MNHRKIIQSLVRSLCIDGERPSVEAQEHLASCRLCFDSLAVLSELIKAGSSQSWYATGSDMFACEGIASEIDWIVTIPHKELAHTNPSIASHINECGICAERYALAQSLLDTENEGLFGGEIRTPERGAGLWVQVKDKLFELTRTITATMNAEAVGFHDLDSHGFPGVLVIAPTGSARSRSTGATNLELQEPRIELSPPTISNSLIFRLVYETEGYVTAEFEITSQVNERLVVALYEVAANDSLIEVRSISDSQPVVKFERLSPQHYVVEIRGQGGKSRIPLNLKREE